MSLYRRYRMYRRNLTDFQRVYLRGLQYEREKKKEAFKGNQYTKSGGTENPHQQNPKTKERLAAKYKLNPDTIIQDSKFAKAVDSIGENLLDVFNKIIDTYTKLQSVKKKKTYSKRHKRKK